MTSAKATLTHGLIFGLAVILTGTTSQAGLYRHIDDHSSAIEREAERAEALVEYNFGHAPRPIVQYLTAGLHGVAQSAHRLHELTDRSGNVLAIDAVTSQLDAQFHDVQKGILVLRQWVEGSTCSVHRFSSCFHSSRPRSVDRANLAALLRRTDDIYAELSEMKTDLQIELTNYYRTHGHSSHGHISSHGHVSSHSHVSLHSHVLAPAPQPRYEPTRNVVPLGTYNRPGHDFSRNQGFSGGRGISSRGNSFQRTGNARFGNRNPGNSRISDSSYVHTQIGGFGLSLRLK